KMIHVAKEDRELDQIRGGAPNRLECQAQVAKDLIRLRGKIVLSDQFAVGSDGGLPGNEDHAAGLDLDQLRVAGRRGKPRRIDAPDRARCVGIHRASPDHQRWCCAATNTNTADLDIASVKLIARVSS